MGFLEELLDQTAEAESPRSFFYWSGLAAIAAVSKRNVFLDKFYYKLYPNIFVMLIARSGMRKSFPVAVAKQLVAGVGNTEVISGRNSIQGVISTLHNVTSGRGKPRRTDASGFLASGEFSTFLVEDPHAFTVLTDLYDGHYNPEWKNTLKSEKTFLKDPILTLLGASNQSHFKERLSAVDVSGGFIARTLLVVEEEKHIINALTKPPKIMLDIPALIERLKLISELKGQFVFTSEGEEFFVDWYHDFNKQKRDDKTGTAERIHDHILKVAMLLSLNQDCSLTLTKENLVEAHRACMTFTANVERITIASGANKDLATKTYAVLQALFNAENYRVGKTKLLSDNYGLFDKFDLERIIETLREAGAIKIDKYGGYDFYTLTPSMVEKYVQLKRAN